MSTNNRRKRFESSYKIPPKEMIMTRHKSALLSKRLRRKDGNVKNKDVIPKITTALNIQTKKKRGRKKEEKVNTEIEKEELVEFYPNLKKRFYVQKTFLKPQTKLRVISGIKSKNKRKLHIPIKNSNYPQDFEDPKPKITKSNLHCSENIDMSEIETCQSPNYSELSMDEVLRFTEDTQDLTDEDFIEILTCPSPVWWEDPPKEEIYIEESIFTRPQTPTTISRPPSKGIKYKTTLYESTRSLHETMSKNDKFKMKQENLENIIGCVKYKNVRSETDNKTNNNYISSYTNKTVEENKQNCLQEIKDQEAGNNSEILVSRKKKSIEERFSISSDNDDLSSLDINFNNDELLEQFENTEIPIENQSIIENNNDNENKFSKCFVPNAITAPGKKGDVIDNVDIESLLQKNVVHRKVIQIMEPPSKCPIIESPSQMKRYKLKKGVKRATGYITLKNIGSNEIIKIVKTRQPNEQELLGDKRKQDHMIDNEFKKTKSSYNIQDTPNVKVAHKKASEISCMNIQNNEPLDNINNVRKDLKILYQVQDYKQKIYKFPQEIDEKKVYNAKKYKTLSEINKLQKPNKSSALKLITPAQISDTNTKNKSILLDTVNKTNKNVIQSINSTQNNRSSLITNTFVTLNELKEVGSIDTVQSESTPVMITDTVLPLKTDITQGNKVLSDIQAVAINEVKPNKRKRDKILHTEKELEDLLASTKRKRKVNPPLKFSSREFLLGNGIGGVKKLLKRDHQNHVRKLKLQSESKNIAIHASKRNNVNLIKTAPTNKTFNTYLNSDSSPTLENQCNHVIKNCDVQIYTKGGNILDGKETKKKSSLNHEANASNIALQSELSNTVEKLFAPQPSIGIKLSKIENKKVKYSKSQSLLTNSQSILKEKHAKFTKKSPKKGNCSTSSFKKKTGQISSEAFQNLKLKETVKTVNDLFYAKYYPAKRNVSILRKKINLNEINDPDNIANNIESRKEPTVHRKKSAELSNNDANIKATDVEIDKIGETDVTKVGLSKNNEINHDCVENFIKNSEPINSVIINEISDANESTADTQKEIKSYYKSCKKTYIEKNEVDSVESRRNDIQIENCSDCQPKPRKAIVVTDQNVKYCMKCSSIFDSEECSYCITKLEQQYVCHICKTSCCCTKKLENHEKIHEKSNEIQKKQKETFKSVLCGECNYEFKDKSDIIGHICQKNNEIKSITSD